jgi:hypothetical protein
MLLTIVVAMSHKLLSHGLALTLWKWRDGKIEDSRIMSQLGPRSLYRTISNAVYIHVRQSLDYDICCESLQDPRIACFHSNWVRGERVRTGAQHRVWHETVRVWHPSLVELSCKML